MSQIRLFLAGHFPFIGNEPVLILQPYNILGVSNTFDTADDNANVPDRKNLVALQSGCGCAHFRHRVQSYERR